MEEFITNNYTAVDTQHIEHIFTIDDFPNNDDDHWMRVAMEHTPKTYQFLSDRLKASTEYIKLAAEEDGNLMAYLPENLKDDYETIMIAVRESAASFQFASERLRDDEEILMTALETAPMNSDSSFMYYASDRLKDTENVIMAGIKRFSSAFGYASSRLSQNVNFAMDALTVDNYYHGRKEVANYMSEKIRKQMGFLLD